MTNDVKMDVLESYVDYLEHHGVDGQRWGKRRGPPYPLGSEDKAKNRQSAKQKRAAEKRKKEIAKTKKRIAKQEKEKAKKQEKETKKSLKERMELEKKKEKYSKTPKSLYVHRELFTYDEISEALKKFDWESKMLDAMDRDFTRSKNTVKNFADYTGSVVRIANNLVDGYDTIAKLNNAFGGQMRTIKSNNQKKDKKDDDD